MVGHGEPYELSLMIVGMARSLTLSVSSTQISYGLTRIHWKSWKSLLGSKTLAYYVNFYIPDKNVL
jgi:hypothetical protein